jgi:tellurite resistance-related uncharacterized protein
MSVPYRSTPVFDETTLPAGLRMEHRTKAGVWGVIHVLEGRLALTLLDQNLEKILTPEVSGMIQPEQPHSVTPLGRARMQIDFYNVAPADFDAASSASLSGKTGAPIAAAQPAPKETGCRRLNVP